MLFLLFTQQVNTTSVSLLLSKQIYLWHVAMYQLDKIANKLAKSKEHGSLRQLFFLMIWNKFVIFSSIYNLLVGYCSQT